MKPTNREQMFVVVGYYLLGIAIGCAIGKWASLPLSPLVGVLALAGVGIVLIALSWVSEYKRLNREEK